MPLQTDQAFAADIMQQFKASGYDWRKVTYVGPYARCGDYLNFSVCFFNPLEAPPERVRVDGNGVVMVSYDGGISFQYNPVTIAQRALFLHSLYMKGGPLDPLFTANADFLLAMQGEDGALRYSFDLQGAELLRSGWASGLAQGQAISVWLRAYKIFGGQKYLDASRKASEFMLKDTKSGGVTGTLADLDPSLERFKIIQEYPYQLDSYTLNGSIFALLGLYDWSEFDPDAMCALKQYAETIRYLLPYYDLGGVTSYDLQHLSYHRPGIAYPTYQMINLVVLWALDSILPNPDLNRTWHTWAAYLDQPLMEAGDPAITATALDSGRGVSLAIPPFPSYVQVRYTLDGSDPTIDAGLLYDQQKPPTFCGDAMVKFRAFEVGHFPSAIITKEVRKLAPPVITQAGTLVSIAAPAGPQVKYLRRYPNLLNPQNWVLGSTGSQPGFAVNGEGPENSIQMGETPYGTTEKMWVASNGDTDADPDGGWNSSEFPIDSTKTYRYSIWLKRTGSWSGYSHLGAGPVSLLTGSTSQQLESSPYFFAGNLGVLGDWELVVGYVRPAGYTGSAAFGKVYSRTGQPVFNTKDFKWLAGATTGQHRSYLYYSADLSDQQRFWSPRVEQVDGPGLPEDVYWASPVASGVSINSTSAGGPFFEAVSYSPDPLLLSSIPAAFQVAVATTVTPSAQNRGRTVALAATTIPADAQVRYTVDGTDPTESKGTIYDPVHPPAFSASATVKFRGFKVPYAASAVVSAQVQKLPPPTITQNASVISVVPPTGAEVRTLRRYPNLLHPENWVLGTSGSQPGFTMNGDAQENAIERGETPYGTTDKLWAAYNRDTTGNADGGWNTATFPIDSTKTYRYSVWLKKSGGWGGNSYLGCGAVSSLNGGSSDQLVSNPYFWYGLLPMDEWELVVGYVHPAGYTGTASSGKVYSRTGQATYNTTDFKWTSGATLNSGRAYLYYATLLTEQQRFWNPRVEIVDTTTAPEDVYWAASAATASFTVSASGGPNLIEAVSCSTNPLLLSSAPAVFEATSATLSALSAPSTGPRLSIGSIAKQLRLSWDDGKSILEETEDINGPWQPVRNAWSSPFEADPAARMKFYRLSR